MSARGTRKEDLDYLSSILGRTRPGNGAVSRLSSGAGSNRVRSSRSATRCSLDVDPRPSGGLAQAIKRRNPGGVRTATASNPKREVLLRIAAGRQRQAPEQPPPKQHPLRFNRIAPLYDVAKASDYASSQDFAGQGIAALAVGADRGALLESGAVKHMLDLILSGRSVKSKADACDALVQLLQHDDGVRHLERWSGTDPEDGTHFHWGSAAIFRLARSRHPELQLAGVAVVGALLMHPSLKHQDRIAPEYLAGLCRFGVAQDEAAARQAASLLVAIMQAVHDSGARWTPVSIAPLADLLRVRTLYPKARPRTGARIRERCVMRGSVRNAARLRA